MNARRGQHLLTRTVVTGWRATLLQLATIYLLHALFFVVVFHPAFEKRLIELGNAASRYLYHACLTPSSQTTTPSDDREPSNDWLVGLAWLLLAGVPLAGVVAWLPFTILIRLPRSHPDGELRLFIRSWYRMCLWAMLALPAGACLGFFISQYELPDWLALACGAVMLTGLLGFLFGTPAFFAHRELKPRRRRLPRWRPECPECGYSLRRAAGERCPECGEAFPTTQRTFRRWAVQRLLWDRRKRGSLLFAYIRTVFAITFCPCRAARRLAMPDRLGRTIRWGAVHVLLAVMLCAVLASDAYYLDWLVKGWGEAWIEPPELAELHRPPGGRVLLWWSQSFCAWLVAIGLLPMLGIGLGMGVPGRHPAARRAITKWSLYATSIIAIVAALTCVWAARRFAWGGFPLVVRSAELPKALITVLAVLYGMYWARGLSANPYLRRRGVRVFLLNWLAFVAVWFVLTSLLFAPGPLKELL